MTCVCGRGKSGRRTDNPLTRTVTTQLVLIERKRKAETRVPFIPYAVIRVVLDERNQRRKTSMLESNAGKLEERT